MGAATSAPSASDYFTSEEQADNLRKLLLASAAQNAQYEAQLQALSEELENSKQSESHLLEQLRDTKIHCDSQNADICEQVACCSAQNSLCVACSYERSSIEAWFAKGKTTSPKTGAELSSEGDGARGCIKCSTA